MSDYDDREEWWHDMLRRIGLTRATAPDGTVWWVHPERVRYYETMPPISVSVAPPPTSLPPPSRRQLAKKDEQ